VTVQPNGQSSRSRNFVVVRGLGPQHTLGVFNNNVRVVERAFYERYLMCKTSRGFEPPLRVKKGKFANEWLVAFRQQVVKKCANAPVVPIPQVVEAYTGPKRRIYEAAALSLSRDKIAPRDARLTSFVKFEKQDLRKAPRVINPRSARYNLVLGKYIKFLEKRVYRAMNRAFQSCTDHTVIKGLNAYQAGAVAQAKWKRFRRPVAVGLDATKFDMHVSVSALRYEHSFYNAIFHNNPELRKLLSWQINNEGVAYCEDGRVKFRMKGTRSSGDLNTSLGNCIIMCSLIYAWSRERGVDLELMNNGDDCVVILEQSDLDRLLKGAAGWFADYGFRMAIEEPVCEFEQIDFCQSSPVMVDHVPVMVRNVCACLRKDAMCLVPVNTPTVFKYWLKAVGDCGLSITSGVPVMQEFYSMFIRNGTEYSEGFLRNLVKNTSHYERSGGLMAKSRVVSEDTRCSFYYAFGILPEMQIELERLFARYEIDADVETLLHEDITLTQGDTHSQPLLSCLYN